MARSLLGLVALCLCCHALSSPPQLTLLGPSAARAAVNAAFSQLLDCASTGDGVSAEQCALIDFDAPALHGVFRQRRLSSDALVVSLVTVDDAPAGAAAAARAALTG